MVELLITEGAEEDYAKSLCWYAERSKRVLIVAVAHTSRRPGYWSGR
jgi:hypothetical protein